MLRDKEKPHSGAGHRLAIGCCLRAHAPLARTPARGYAIPATTGWWRRVGRCLTAFAQDGLGDYFWSGLILDYFFIDPVERIIAIFITQLMPSSAYPVRRELRALVYSALAESRA